MSDSESDSDVEEGDLLALEGSDGPKSWRIHYEGASPCHGANMQMQKRNSTKLACRERFHLCATIGKGIGSHSGPGHQRLATCFILDYK
ncbi:hypothetical protein H5410_057278 [Solanum commersonii]|uniref:Uncharacterized protein n=1 Tax=Solanum commersonii TaxID=4109 RepID=A0A9J5WQ47_SOLCO|nr:hypothetical protein H5410_057278 [Solanum commersonii]